LIKSQSKCFAEDIEEEKILEILENLDIKKFKLPNDLVLGNEKLMDYFCLKYLNGITSLR